jgi:molybdopterin converting factor small subunit
MPTIEIPTPLRPYANNNAKITVSGETVREALADLLQQYPDLQKHLRDRKGNLRSFVNIYVGDEDIRSLDQEDTALEDDDELIIIPSIAGGFNEINQ